MSVHSTRIHRVNRENLLRQLQAVRPGISKKKSVEQSDCFVFRSGTVRTFNGETACVCPCDLKIECAVPAAQLLAILKSLRDEFVKLKVSEGKLVFLGGEDYLGQLNIDTKIRMPYRSVESPKRWKLLPKDIDKSLRLMVRCAHPDHLNEIMHCVHFHPHRIEACDLYQIGICRINLGLKKSRLVFSSSLKCILGRKMAQVCITPNWLHFRNHDGLIISCRSRRDKYPEMEYLLDFSGDSVDLPKSLIQSIGRVEVFTSKDDDLIQLELSKGKLLIRGDNANGWYEEDVDVAYQGGPIEFQISLNNLIKLTRFSNGNGAGDNRVIFGTVNGRQDDQGNPIGVASFDGGNVVYMTSLGRAKESA